MPTTTSRAVALAGTQMGGLVPQNEIRPWPTSKGLKFPHGGGQQAGMWCRKTCLRATCTRPWKGQRHRVRRSAYDDEKLGFNKVARSITTPAGGKVALNWVLHQRQAYAALPAEFQAIVDAATTVAARDMTAKIRRLQPHRSQAPGGREDQLKAFPKEIMDAGYKASMEALPSTAKALKNHPPGHARLPA